MKLIPANENARVGDMISDFEQITGFVGVDAEGQTVTETCEMYGDAKCQPFVVSVFAVAKSID